MCLSSLCGRRAASLEWTCPCSFMVCVHRVFSKIHPFLQFQMHHIITNRIFKLPDRFMCPRIDFNTVWLLCARDGMTPIMPRHLLAKLHLKKRWDNISSLRMLQFSHEYESNSIFLLLSIDFVLSLSRRISQMKIFCFDWHFDFHININMGSTASPSIICM